MDGNSGWYDAHYGDDPSTDNVFGREELVERRNPALREFLKAGGRIGDFCQTKRDPEALLALMDRILGL